jgi:hypothetical protein
MALDVVSRSRVVARTLYLIRAIIPDLTKAVRHGNILPLKGGCHGQAQATETRPPAYRR